MSDKDFVPASLRIGKHEVSSYTQPTIEAVLRSVNASYEEFKQGNQDWYDTRNLILSMKTLIERLMENKP